MKSFFRYPGGKSKFKKVILEELALFGSNHQEYREPFFGGGSIGLNMIAAAYPLRVWINDKDIGIAALWRSVADYPGALIDKIRTFTPSVADFHETKAFFLNDPPIPVTPGDIVQTGFNKLVLHQLSYSGLGIKSGGPLGGQKQTSKYPIDCRWSPDSMSATITKLHDQFRKKHVKITHGDFADLITDDSAPALLYLDPPYYDKGEELYHHAFTDADHERLSHLLRKTEHQWVLSYDNADRIKELYSWATLITIDANYTINTSTQKYELLIFSPDHESRMRLAQSDKRDEYISFV